ncbi:hypothetical protein [Pseudomonas fluorescens]|uniref:Uncharacterized protein n=1 Tax=Pseudomonas fluorescens TaxID=294 RepID=A0A5E7T3J3_PSEFL|nr:hypothetical protein [Pseudomonas fluorescens]VVP90273.1 hypothetical protein PS941_01614 [Pseudomonas fluorescens]
MSTDRSKDENAQTRNVLFSIVEDAVAASRYRTADIAATPTTGKEDSSDVVPHQTGENTVTAQTGGIYPFRGQVFFKWQSLGTKVRFEKIEYKIEKGNNNGGNNANVSIGLIGGSIITAKTDHGIQDGQWHTLTTNLEVNWSYAIFLVAEFIFDKSMAADPEASAVDTIYL